MNLSRWPKLFNIVEAAIQASQRLRTTFTYGHLLTIDEEGDYMKALFVVKAKVRARFLTTLALNAQLDPILRLPV